MIVLKLSKKLLKFIGVYHEESSSLVCFFFKLFVNLIFICGMFVPLVIGSLAYIYVNYMDLKTSTNAIVVLMAGCSGLGCYCGILLNVKSTRHLFIILQTIADESKSNK